MSDGARAAGMPPRSTYIATMPDPWLVPPTLADLECEHGRIEPCPECRQEETKP